MGQFKEPGSFQLLALPPEHISSALRLTPFVFVRLLGWFQYKTKRKKGLLLPSDSFYEQGNISQTPFSPSVDFCHLIGQN